MVGYGMGNYTSVSTFAMVSLYLPYFYTDVFLLPPAVMAILFLSCRAWDGINDPIMGIIADSTESRWGRFRPYLLFAPFFMIVFGTLTFTVPDMSTTGKIIWAFATYIPLQMIKTAISIPYYALMPVITTDTKERTIISAIQQLATPIAFMAASIFVLKIVGLFPTESQGFFYSALIFCIVAAIVMWITFFSTRSYDYPGNPLFKKEDSQQKVLIKDKLKVLTKNRPLILVISAFAMLNLSMAVSYGVGIYFFKYNLDMYDKFPMYIGLSVLAGMVGAASAPFLVKRLGKRNLLQIANLTSFIIGMTVIYLSLGKDQTTLRELWYPGRICFVLAIVTQPFTGIVATMLGALLPDCVEYAEWKTGLRAEGLVNSLYMAGNKAGYAVGGVILGLGLAYFEYTPNQPSYSEATLTGIFLMLFGVSAICRVVLGTLMAFHNLPESRFQEILAELKIRKRAESVVV
jgi:sugar (glycoside-pentoside-hexuronide) transporter